jgi:DNA-directed RNA polymerase III subunit RPC1
LSYLARKALRKQIQVRAKKFSICPHCGDINGVVKKSGLLKITHEKYRNKKPDPAMLSQLGNFSLYVNNYVYYINSCA